MTLKRLVCGVAVIAATQLLPWTHAEDVASSPVLSPPEQSDATTAATEDMPGLAEEAEEREMNHRLRYYYPGSYVLPSSYYYPRYSSYPRYLETERASQRQGGPQVVSDVPDQTLAGETTPEERELQMYGHHHHYGPGSYGHYHNPPGYYYGFSPYMSGLYPRYLKRALSASPVDDIDAAESKRLAASGKVRNMGHRRRGGGQYYVRYPNYYGSYYGYKGHPYSYVQYPW